MSLKNFSSILVILFLLSSCSQTDDSKEIGWSDLIPFTSIFNPSDVKFNKDNAPKPSNSDIEILTIEGGYYAVIEYSGRSSDKNFLKNKDILEKLLKQDNITILSPPIRASYNSPFTLPMLKRNEVMYRIDL